MILPFTPISIVDPHFQSRELVRQAEGSAGFRKVGYFWKFLAHTLHFEKLSDNNKLRQKT